MSKGQSADDLDDSQSLLQSVRLESSNGNDNGLFAVNAIPANFSNEEEEKHYDGASPS